MKFVASLFMILFLYTFCLNSFAQEDQAKSENNDLGKNKQIKRELLSSHDTIATFQGVQKRICRFRTSLCPNRCEHGGLVAVFQINQYINWNQVDKDGDDKQTSFLIMIENNNGLLISDDLRTTINNLKKDDMVHLVWSHDYVTISQDGGSCSSPERLPSLIQKISEQQKTDLLNKKTSTDAKSVDSEKK